MSHYVHLSIEERESILEFGAKGRSLRAISRELGRSASTVSRELKRNKKPKGSYRPSVAQAHYRRRRKKCRRAHLLENADLRAKVMELFLEKHWSPEQIQQRLRLENSEYQISYATIYRGIYKHLLEPCPLRDGQRGVVLRLRHKGKRRHPTGKKRSNCGKLTNMLLIDDRPESAENRSEIGHWEADTVAGALNTGRILTLVDRKTRFALCTKLNTKDAEETAQAMIKVLLSLPAEARRSVTPDQGKEFFGFRSVSHALNGLSFFFAHPASPWERPSNENFNSLLREFFPKRISFADISESDVQFAVALLNTRPRKCLAFRSPFEVFSNSLLRLT